MFHCCCGWSRTYVFKCDRDACFIFTPPSVLIIPQATWLPKPVPHHASHREVNLNLYVSHDCAHRQFSCWLLQAVAGKVTDEELARAKKATISSVLMNLESRAVVAEDIGRQVLTYGHRYPSSAPNTWKESCHHADSACHSYKLQPCCLYACLHLVM